MKSDIVMYFSEVVCLFLLIYFQVHMSEISAKSDKFLLNYNKLSRGPLYIWTQCSYYGPLIKCRIRHMHYC